MDAILLSLLLWINQNTDFDYDINRGLPAVVQVDQMTLARLIIDDETTIEKEKHTAAFKNFVNQLEAVYDYHHKIIFISSKIDLSSQYAHSVIVHELIHFIQYQQGMDKKVSCRNELERDAYEVQALYMETHNIPKNFDKATIVLRSICWDQTE